MLAKKHFPHRLSVLLNWKITVLIEIRKKYDDSYNLMKSTWANVQKNLQARRKWLKKELGIRHEKISLKTGVANSLSNSFNLQQISDLATLKYTLEIRRCLNRSGLRSFMSTRLGGKRLKSSPIEIYGPPHTHTQFLAFLIS